MNGIAFALFAGLVFFWGWWLGYDDGQEDLQDDLVKQGKAEYYLDENNERQWRIK